MSMRYPGGFIASTPVTAAYPSGVWTQAQAIPYQAQNVWTRDQFWPYTTLLLQGNGTNGAQNNTFLDSSSNNFTITRNGNTTQGSFTPYEANGYWSNGSFSGSNYLTYNPGSSAAFGTGDFTVEAWVFATDALSSGDNPYICDTRGGGGAWSLSWNYNGTSNPWQLAWANSSVLQSSTSMNINTWNHCAYVRSGTTGTLYLNGVSIATWTDNYNYSASVTSITIGRRNSLNTGTQFLPGYLSNFRIVKGTAVYTSAFTPSAAPLTAITNTVLLTCQSNRFIDNSSSAYAITVNGSPSVQAFQPFPGATTYSGTVLGGSGYFDGAGDYLDTPTTGVFAPTGDFTVSAWFYPISLSANNIIVGNYTGPPTTADWQINITSANNVEFYTNGSTLRISGGPVNIGSWNHFILARSGSTITGYLNGASLGTYTQSGTFGSSSKIIRIGARPQSGSELPVTGYISDVKLIDGSAVATVPTAPQTATSGTRLLLNFTNAGIFDAAVMNNLETVGNAQVSTSVVKYGTGSMAFDGTGDWLTMPNSKGLYIGSGDFTIEGWLYLNALGSVRAIVSQFNSNGTGPGWTLYTKTTNVLEFYGGSGTVTVTGTTAIAAATWTHFAVVRSGSTITIYVNGVAGGTATNSSFSDDTTALGYVGGRADSSSIALNGYIDDLRITKGAARYITNFTPPPARMPGQ